MDEKSGFFSTDFVLKIGIFWAAFQEIDFASAVVSYQMIARAKSSSLCAAAHALVQPFLTM